MLMWIMNNISTIIICAGLAAVVVLVILSMIRSKKQGKSSCGCNCRDCAMSGSCHGKK